MLGEMKATDDRHLYTTTSFTFEKGHGDWPENQDDFFVTQWTKKGWVRGQGVFNQELPSFDKDFRASIEGMEVPLVTHEVGQYSVYPDLTEIPKYTGTLMPLERMGLSVIRRYKMGRPLKNRENQTSYHYCTFVAHLGDENQ